MDDSEPERLEPRKDYSDSRIVNFFYKHTILGASLERNHEKIPRSLWIAAGGMAGYLCLILIGFILRLLGYWNDGCGKILAVLCFPIMAFLLFAVSRALNGPRRDE